MRQGRRGRARAIGSRLESAVGHLFPQSTSGQPNCRTRGAATQPRVADEPSWLSGLLGRSAAMPSRDISRARLGFVTANQGAINSDSRRISWGGGLLSLAASLEGETPGVQRANGSALVAVSPKQVTDWGRDPLKEVCNRQNTIPELPSHMPGNNAVVRQTAKKSFAVGPGFRDCQHRMQCLAARPPKSLAKLPKQHSLSGSSW